MNRAQLVEKISDRTNIAKSDVDLILKEYMKQVKKSVQHDDPVRLIGFGTFRKAKRAGRFYVHPATGERAYRKTKNVVKFVPGKAFKKKVNTKLKKKKVATV